MQRLGIFPGMGTNNRARRAAKYRRRHRPPGTGRPGGRPDAPNGPPSGTAPGGSGCPPPGAPTPPVDPADPPPTRPQLLERLVVAGQLVAAGKDAAVELYVGRLAAVDRAWPGLIDDVAQELLERLVRTAWEQGWQPRDLAELTRRRAAGAEAVLSDVIASEHRRYPASSLAPAWRRQLDELGIDRGAQAGTRRWWSSVGRAGADRLQACCRLVGALLSPPALPRLMPLPGTAVPGPADRAETAVDERMLARIRGLLAKAEATDFAAEAEALSAKAQELMARYSLDRALVDARSDQGTVPPGASARRVWLDAPYVSAKADLVHHVARTNGCRVVTYGRLGMVTVVGAELDLDLTELLVTSLLVQAGRAMAAAGARSGGSRTRSFRHSFLVAYAVRIGERLRAAGEEARVAATAADPESLLPVLAARDREVADRFTELFPDTVARRTSVSDRAGWQAGRAAADLASLNTRRPVTE